MFRPLRVFADVPSLRALLPLCLIARVHLSALLVALSFLVADWTGSYTIVGAVSGDMAIAQAVAGTLRRPEPAEAYQVSPVSEVDTGAQG
ncbi:hypothetical protein OIU91_40445 [Streptomyces sp. NBC_01456]|uniref:hypothetical protein n=1 Tax=unclassified Streptomyces TaxID=2593676 RepID=UPI002E37A1AF|nr:MULTISPECIES: hypothetical protein [unclassified Streptomyces]